MKIKQFARKWLGIEENGHRPSRKAVTTSGSVGWTFLLGSESRLSPSDINWSNIVGDLWENPIVRCAAMWKLDAMSEAPQVVRRTNGDDVDAIRPHPLTEFLKNPNPYMLWDELQAAISLSLDTDGNAYIHKARAASGDLAALELLPAHTISPIAGPAIGQVEKYEYRYGTTQKLDIFPKDMIHIRLTRDPKNMISGLSRLGGVMREIAATNEASTYIYAILKNSGVPSVALLPKNEEAGMAITTEDDITRIQDLWERRFTGDQRGRPFVASIPMDVNSIGFSPEDLALESLWMMPINLICAALNIDPMVLGLPSPSKTYSNFREANEAAYRGCIIPELRIIDKAIGHGLRDEIPGYEENDLLGRDLAGIRYLLEDEDKIYRRLGIAVGKNNALLTINEARAQLGYEPVDMVEIQQNAGEPAPNMEGREEVPV